MCTNSSRIRRAALGSLAVLIASIAPASTVVAIPNTPAGGALAAWLTAFNSGARDQLQSFYRAYEPDASLDYGMGFRAATGGFDLVSIHRSEPRHIEFLVTDRASHGRGLGELDVTGTSPERVSKIRVFSFDFDADAPVIGFEVDAAVRARVIRGVAAKLGQLYVLPDVGDKMGLDITDRWQRGQYDAMTEGDEFAQQLTNDLRTVSHDKHLGVEFSPARLPVDLTRESTAFTAEQKIGLERNNCGFRQAEWLPGNIGYLRFDQFGPPSVCTQTAVAAMGFLANADALIFDMRWNHGGNVDLVTLLESYLFASPTHREDYWHRTGGRTTEAWTLTHIPGKRLPSVPVYVLTSASTFSGAEAFAYELQALKRATVVGEVTAGGSHFDSRADRVDARFFVQFPTAREINPITKTDWEGRGVVPNVKVPASQALDVAEKLGSEELAKRRSAQEKRNRP